MSAPTIRVDGLCKRYRLGAQKPRYRTLRDAIAGWASRRRSVEPRDFWALRDVSFEVRQGQVLGVIGNNGAGKSTLLKVLSRITEPSGGRVEIRGRVGSLLEVGTGFHPELTGRDNVYLNGAILGMKRSETDRRFDEIVAFAEVEDFVDTPVKHYSSGMYLRLAFAVAAHLEPEILLVDEVLAVGDARFQQKCIAKMGDVARQGRTVLMVSHNLGVVQDLCDEAILLHQGTLQVQAKAADAVALYLRSIEQKAAVSLADRQDRNGGGQTRLTEIRIQATGAGNPGGVLVMGKPASFGFLVGGPVANVVCNFTVYNQRGQPVANFRTDVPSGEDRRGPGGFVCEIDEMLLTPGHYRINAALVRDGQLEDHVEAAATFDVEAGSVRGRPGSASKYALVSIPHRWVQPLL